jgi:RNA methyltransferase, TrmH family
VPRPVPAASFRAPRFDRLPGETISSRTNAWLKRFRAALARGEGGAAESRPTGSAERAGAVSLIGAEGERLIEEAFRSELAVEALLVSPAGEQALERLGRWLGPGRRVRLLRTSERLFATVSATESPQGIAALVRPRAFRFEDLAGGVPLIVVLAGVQDPGNVGTIVRSAEAFGATGVIAAAGTANPLGPKALRASAGSAFRVPLVARVGLPIALAQLRIAGLKFFAATAREPAQEPEQVDWRGPAALLVGSEAAGLPEEIERAADARVRIPLAAGVDSLNAGVAASVLLYEAARQRGGRG